MPLDVFPIAETPGSKIVFYDWWHAPRPGGRLHEGVDVMAAMGMPVLAVDNGHVSFGVGGTSGNWASIALPDKTRYFYAHLESFTGKERDVVAGEQIGTVGMTGNAAVSGIPHVHFEVRPGGGDPINAFEMLKQARRLKAPVTTMGMVSGGISWGPLVVLAGGLVATGWWWLRRRRGAGPVVRSRA